MNSFRAETERLQAIANRLSDTAALFQALGGGWWEAQEGNALSPSGSIR